MRKPLTTLGYEGFHSEKPLIKSRAIISINSFLSNQVNHKMCLTPVTKSHENRVTGEGTRIHSHAYTHTLSQLSQLNHS